MKRCFKLSFPWGCLEWRRRNDRHQDFDPLILSLWSTGRNCNSSQRTFKWYDQRHLWSPWILSKNKSFLREPFPWRERLTSREAGHVTAKLVWSFSRIFNFLWRLEMPLESDWHSLLLWLETQGDRKQGHKRRTRLGWNQAFYGGHSNINDMERNLICFIALPSITFVWFQCIPYLLSMGKWHTITLGIKEEKNEITKIQGKDQRRKGFQSLIFERDRRHLKHKHKSVCLLHFS